MFYDFTEFVRMKSETATVLLQSFLFVFALLF